MLDLLAFIDALLPPKGERDRRWWSLGIILGGAVFALGVFIVIAESFWGAS